MTWDFAGEISNLTFNTEFTVAIAAMMFYCGFIARKKFYVLRRFSVSSGVAGGLIMALIVWFLYFPGIAVVHFDYSLQMPLIAMFFTRVGLTGSFTALRKGGRTLIYYLLACWALVLFQNLLGVGLASLFDMHPLLGIMAGAVSMEGGHNLAVIFGPLAESMGVSGAAAAAMAAATFGIIAGGLLGAPMANWLIKRHDLELMTNYDDLYKGYHEDNEKEDVEVHDFIQTLGIIVAIMAVGQWGAEHLESYINSRPNWNNFTLPGYLGAMFLAVTFRNLNDHFKLIRVHPYSMDLISRASVSLFLTTSMMGLRIWELYSLALPLILILIAQAVSILLITVSIIFPLMGGDYDAAIMCSGFVGHGLGSPSNAVSTMRAACENHNLPSYKAFLIVPLCSAVLIDLVALPLILWFMQIFAS
ncbi:glutamate/sodium ion symporter GltS [Synergistales bacterium]|nr:glutamate/sodium ion symporter GltS [Synergistales bacterium]